MNIFEIIAKLIDMRSFSNLWYWIALAVVWSSASHWVLGVPWDMVGRARRKGAQAENDLVTLTLINARRLNVIWADAGVAIAIVLPFLLSFLGFTGFFYGAEIAQAVFLFALPLSAVFALSMSLAHRLCAQSGDGLGSDLVIRALSRHRVWVQAIGIAAIIVTSFWGMFQNLRFSALF
ncbi:component of SufBCD complex [uncultured Thioclava sp.]|uniref:component of SufBCD complex n=1 Tax=uncultured Thioclava sp. TaxID=473858 RepID=UPI0025FC79E0|nr:component of SufBCD complex [uncultured Thioclava sp.]